MPGLLDVPGVEGKPVPFGRVVGIMDRVVAPPRPVVVPEVVVRVLPVDPDLQYGLVHLRLSFRQNAYRYGYKKTTKPAKDWW